MAFPKKVLGIAIGWKDLGRVGEKYSVVGGETVATTETHGFCKARTKIGKEGEDLFKFCPRCLVKLQA